MGRFFKALLVIIGCLIGADIAGVVVCLIFEILPLEGISTALFYTVWFVAGVFCGLFSYDAAGRKLCPVDTGDWTGSPEAGKWGLATIAITLVILIGLSVGFEKLVWKVVTSSDPYVPDNMPMSITFFVAIAGAMIVGHTVLRPNKST